MGKKRDAQTAQAQIDLQYGPQFAQVRDLWHQTHNQYVNDLSAARETARATQQQAKASQPVVKKIYDTAEKSLDSSSSFVDRALAATTAPGAESGLSGLLNTAMQRERGSAANANTAARTTSLNALVQRASDAQAGKDLAYSTAKQNLLSSRKTLTQKIADLTGEKGNALTVLTNQLADKRDATRATTQSAQAKTDAAAQKRRQQLADAKQTHVEKVRTATGNYANKITDAASLWKQYSTQTVTDKNGNPIPIRDPVMENGKTKLDKNGNPMTKVRLGTDGKPVYDTSTPTPSDLKQMLLAERDDKGHIKFTPGDVHIMLLRRANKPMDAEAMAYLRRMAAKGVRIPREWLPNPGSGGNAPSRTGMGDFQ